ncbi:MAG: hypothetical protein LBU65_14320 [Planctomycetaceae bacterium]|jgi:hypothetical protein|nr:hypothetical protein [Planctomycetaceae bacterium]
MKTIYSFVLFVALCGSTDFALAQTPSSCVCPPLNSGVTLNTAYKVYETEKRFNSGKITQKERVKQHTVTAVKVVIGDWDKVIISIPCWW